MLQECSVRSAIFQILALLWIGLVLGIHLLLDESLVFCNPRFRDLHLTVMEWFTAKSVYD